ncbi:MAG: hypothetical protein ACYDHX_06365 [Methanothrix sp.]
MEQEKQAIAKIRLGLWPGCIQKGIAPRQKFSGWEVTPNILRHGHVANAHWAIRVLRKYDASWGL